MSLLVAFSTLVLAAAAAATAVAAAASAAAAGRTATPRCEPVTVPACADMPYSRMHLPNEFGQTNQSEAGLALQGLVDGLPRPAPPVLLAFLCAVYVPGCRQRGAHYLPPCRANCQRARAAYGAATGDGARRRGWPKRLRCSRYPRRRNPGLCHDWRLKAESRRRPDQTTHYRKRPSSNIITVVQPVCPRKKYPKRIKRKEYFRKKFDYAVKATFLSAEGIVGGPLIATIHVQRVLKRSHVRILRANLTLWAESGRVCPQLKAGRHYLILGYEEARNKRLLFTEDSVALVWRKAFARRITNWEARCDKPDSAREVGSKPRKRKRCRKHHKRAGGAGVKPNHNRKRDSRRIRRPNRSRRMKPSLS